MASKLLRSCLLVLTVLLMVNQGCCRHVLSDFELLFARKSTNSYVIHWNGLNIISGFTVCFWKRTTSQIGAGIFSYATNSHDNELLVFHHNDIGQVHFWVGQQLQSFAVPKTNNGQWHHICAQWKKSDGSWAYYQDGFKRGGANSGFKQGYSFQRDGVLVIGQDQDSKGGGFVQTQSFQGELAHVNVWNYQLSSERIKMLSLSCPAGAFYEGNLKKWSDFHAGINGDVRVISPAAC